MKSFGYRGHFVLAGILLQALLVCALSQSTASCQEMKPEEMYQKVLPSIATLLVEKTDGTKSFGNAFMGVKDGIGLTAWHVVKDARRVVAKFSNGEEFEVSGLLDKDERRDIALVKVKVFGRPALALNPEDPPVGSKAYVIGAPEGLQFSISEGLVSQVQTLDGIKYYQFSCSASPGSSGGPLVNIQGEVLGVVSWQLRAGQNLNFAIPAAYVLGLDSTLPTQPWLNVKAEGPMVGPVSTDPAKADEVLAESLNADLDAITAINGTLWVLKQPVYTEKRNIWTWNKKRTWRLVTPVYLFQCQNDLPSKIDALTGLAVDGPRAVLRDGLLRDLKAFSEVVQGLTDTIKTLQKQSGWDAEANDMLAKTVALLPKAPPCEQSVLEEVAKSSGFVTRLSQDTQLILGLSRHEDWFPLSVLSFTRNPLGFVVVDERGTAYKLGFRSNDLVLSVAGLKADSLLALKAIIKANAGKDVEAIVRRDGKEEKLKMSIPKALK